MTFHHMMKYFIIWWNCIIWWHHFIIWWPCIIWWYYFIIWWNDICDVIFTEESLLAGFHITKHKNFRDQPRPSTSSHAHCCSRKVSASTHKSRNAMWTANLCVLGKSTCLDLFQGSWKGYKFTSWISFLREKGNLSSTPSYAGRESLTNARQLTEVCINSRTILVMRSWNTISLTGTTLSHWSSQMN